MSRRLRFVVPTLLLLALAWACGPSDPRERVMIQRALWRVDLLSWVAAEDGSITINARVSGPVRTQLKKLTVRVELVDADNAPIDSEWQTLDLGGIRRGGPEDLFIRLAPREGGAAGVEGIRIDTVPDPGPDEAGHLVELQDLE